MNSKVMVKSVRDAQWTDSRSRTNKKQGAIQVHARGETDLYRVEGRTRAWEVVGMESTGDAKMKSAATWKWKERDQVYVMRQGNVLDDKKRVTDMVEEGGVIEV